MPSDARNVFSAKRSCWLPAPWRRAAPVAARRARRRSARARSRTRRSRRRRRPRRRAARPRPRRRRPCWRRRRRRPGCPRPGRRCACAVRACAAASASMRPSCPPPRMPMRVARRGCEIAARVRSPPRGRRGACVGRRPRVCAARQAASRSASVVVCSASTAAASSAALIAPAGRSPAFRPARRRHLHDRIAARRVRRALWSGTGTPNTGSGVIAAVMPGRCAAPPAPAMMTGSPSACAPLAKATSRSGVRWADTMRASRPTPSASSVSAACRIVAQSDWLPMMMATGLGGGGPGSWGDTVWRLAGDFRS